MHPDKMHYTHITMTIGELENDYKTGKYNLNPYWQRDPVWPKKMHPEFINAIRRGTPVPELCIWEQADGIKVPVDGKQRSTSFFQYIDAVFPVDKRKFSKLTAAEMVAFRSIKFSVLLLGPKNTEAEVIAYYKTRNSTSKDLRTGELFKADSKTPVVVASNAAFAARKPALNAAFGEKKAGSRSSDLQNTIPYLASYVKDDMQFLTQAYKGIAGVLSETTQEEVDAKLPEFYKSLDKHIEVCGHLRGECASLDKTWAGLPPLRKVSSIWLSIVKPDKIDGMNPVAFWSAFYKALAMNHLDANAWEKMTRANASPGLLDDEIVFAKKVIAPKPPA